MPDEINIISEICFLMSNEIHYLRMALLSRDEDEKLKNWQKANNNRSERDRITKEAANVKSKSSGKAVPRKSK